MSGRVLPLAWLAHDSFCRTNVAAGGLARRPCDSHNDAGEHDAFCTLPTPRTAYATWHGTARTGVYAATHTAHPGPTMTRSISPPCSFWRLMLLGGDILDYIRENLCYVLATAGSLLSIIISSYHRARERVDRLDWTGGKGRAERKALILCTSMDGGFSTCNLSMQSAIDS